MICIVFQLLKASALDVVTLVFIIALGAMLLGSSAGLMKMLTVGSVEYNITNLGLFALKSYGDYFNLIVIAIIFVAILGIIMIVGGAARQTA